MPRVSPYSLRLVATIPNDRTEAGDEQNPYRFTPFHITSSRGDERSYPIEQRLRCVMRLGADRCKALRHRTGASGSLRVRQSGPGDFIRCERRHTDPMGACSRLCERTQPVRRRSLNAAARSLPQCRHRHRRSRWSIRTFPTVSRWPLPQWSGIWTRAILRRRSALVNGMTVALLVGSAPPLPICSRTFRLEQGVVNDPCWIVVCRAVGATLKVWV